jgi:16S rRNA (cytosine967-C5)-methyltransferase
MGGKGNITSCDVHEHKTALIQNGAERLGISNITVRQQDATALVPEWVETMDAVICDAPCSGLGIIRKKPDIRYKNLKEMEELPALQLRILSNQANYVKPGGVLMYSTCTVLRRENEDVVKAFLDSHVDFCLEPLDLPDVFPVNETGMLTLIPGEYDTDGFFISRLRRKV